MLLLKNAILFASLFLLASCASQKKPTGGPVDTTPPEIISTYPDSAAVNFKDNKLRIEFNKWMNRNSIYSAVFFSPSIKDYEVEWSGKEAEFIIYDTLKQNRTYSLTLTNALKDIRGNSLASSYTLAFSTGNAIDSGQISGQIFDALNKPARGVLVCAYLLPYTLGLNTDTLNPGTVEPDNIAQTNSEGQFTLKYLAEGTYRVIGIKDENANLKLDLGSESFGVPTLWPLQTGMKKVKMRLKTEDTLSIELQTVTAQTRHMVSIRFDREILTDSLSPDAFSIYDSTALKSLKVYDFYAEQQNKNPYIFLMIDSLSEDHFYHLHVNEVWDKYGNTGKNLAGQFFGITEPDTLKATLRAPFSDSTRQVLVNEIPDRFGKAIELNFTRPIERQSFLDAFSLQSQSNDGFQTIPSTIHFKDARNILIRPENQFQLGMWYKMVLKHSLVKDALGRPTLDSTFAIRFQIADMDLYGGIEGRLVMAEPKTTVISAWGLGKTKPYRTLVKPSLNSDQMSFQFTTLPEGQYFLTAFIPGNQGTEDKFQEWFGGKCFPTVPAEAFVIGRDTLRVRKRWTTSDVILEIK